MKALLLLDNSLVFVQQLKMDLWQNIDTKELYTLHKDIELIYG